MKSFWRYFDFHIDFRICIPMQKNIILLLRKMNIQFIFFLLMIIFNKEYFFLIIILKYKLITNFRKIHYYIEKKMVSWLMLDIVVSLNISLRYYIVNYNDYLWNYLPVARRYTMTLICQ